MPTHQAISLDASALDPLAGLLGEMPETTIAVPLLRRCGDGDPASPAVFL